MGIVNYIDKAGNLKKSDLKIKKKVVNGLPFIDVAGTLMMPIIVGVIAGYYIDKWLQRQPIFTILGLLLGIITVVYNFYQLLTKKNGR